MTRSNTIETREQWLTEAVAKLRPFFEGTDTKPTDKLAAIVSWPRGKKSAIGQCFLGDHWTEDGTVYVTVSPELGEDPTRVLDVLLHELVHACGIGGHGKDFKKVATAVGLTGKMTATVATEELKERLQVIADELGPYPHKVMRPAPEGNKKHKSGKRSHAKFYSAAEPSYTAWVARKQFEAFGAPVCPISGDPMLEADE